MKTLLIVLGLVGMLAGCEEGSLPDDDIDTDDTDTEICAEDGEICYEDGEREIENGWEWYVIIDIPCCDTDQRCERVTVPPGEDTQTYKCIDWTPTTQ